MRTKCKGRRTVFFESVPRLVSGSTVVGDVEGKGPLGRHFDFVMPSDTWGEDTWEKTERKMFEYAVTRALDKVGLESEDADILLGGDLLNQIITANFAARELKIPFIGLYGACSTMAESLLVGAMLIDGGFASRVACAASSHFCTVERQFRLPLEMGAQNTPTAQRTVTGAACSLITDANMSLRPQFSHVAVTHGTIGRVVDLGITDAANMGAAMAPAAADTIQANLEDMGVGASYYDIIITGDLGSFGSALLHELCAERGIDIEGRHVDCGNLIYSEEQNVDCGGSGCGCSAVTLNGYLLKRLETGDFSRALFLATGALMSPASGMQGESIPGIAHAVAFERR